MPKLKTIAGPKSKLNQIEVCKLVKHWWETSDMKVKDMSKELNKIGARTGPNSREFQPTDVSCLATQNLRLPKKKTMTTKKTKGLDIAPQKRTRIKRKKGVDIFKLIQDVMTSNMAEESQRTIVEVLRYNA